MDKHDEQHLEEYAKQIGYLEERLTVTRKLYNELKAKKEQEVLANNDSV